MKHTPTKGTTMNTEQLAIEPYMQNLFNHMLEEHGLTLLESEMQQIVHICKAYQAQEGEVVKLTVWENAMPESNGKSNFTAILMRKGGELHEGITIARSEYPDRVRYEADRVRYLIGEIADEPFILDYDSDKHSGYKCPPSSQARIAELEATNKKLLDALKASNIILISEGIYSNQVAINEQVIEDAQADHQN
jgi:hypothetical protein